MNDKEKILVKDEFLSGDRIFTDAIIGISLSKSRFASLNQTARKIGCSRSRISKGAERLERSGYLIKIPNYIILDDMNFKGDSEKIKKFRIDLFKHHGILTPEPFTFGGCLQAALYAPNSYIFSLDAKRLKDEQHLKLKLKKDSRLVPLAKTSKFNIWLFNTKVYNFNNYLNDYGFTNL